MNYLKIYLNKLLSIDNRVILGKKYLLSTKKLKISIFIIFFLLFIPFLAVMIKINFNILSILVLILYLFIARKVKTWMKMNIAYTKEDLKIREALLYLLSTNRFYTTYNSRKGVTKVRSACLSFGNYNDCIVVSAYITGDQFTDQLRELDEKLSATLGFELEEKHSSPTKTDYFFKKYTFKRLVLHSETKQTNDSIDIPLGQNLAYNASKVPHVLISGGTGSGKSMMISYLILEFLKQQSKIYICDPKNSDLGSLSHYLGEERVAYTPNNIARIVRTVVEEMNQRYEEMRTNFNYGANFQVHGYKPIWLIFDEMGAFKATGVDKNSKAIIDEVMKNFQQIVLLGRQAGCFIIVSGQQMNSFTLSTELRDNLGLRIALGANSSEGYRMVLGNFAKDLKPIDKIGGGYLYMQGSGKENAQYYETPYFSDDFDFIEELQKYL